MNNKVKLSYRRKGIFIKKIVVIFIVVLLVLGAVGAFSVNYIFDKMIGNQILSQLELEVLPDDFIEDLLDNGSEKEIGKVEKDTEDKKSNDSTSQSKGTGTAMEEKPEGDKQFTTDRLKEIQDDFSTMDKLKVVTMLTSKLSMDEIKELSGLATGGVDKEELNNIKKSLKEKLSAKDVEYLKGLYEKYN